jgi:hypothetical protein
MKFRISNSSELITSHYRSYEYKLNVPQHSILQIGKCSQEEGLHSYMIPDINETDKRSKRFFESFYPGFLSIDERSTLYLAKIPKGTRYYIGKGKDIASESLVLIEPLISNTNAFDEQTETEVVERGNIMAGIAFVIYANEILRKEGYKNQNY